MPKTKTDTGPGEYEVTFGREIRRAASTKITIPPDWKGDPDAYFLKWLEDHEDEVEFEYDGEKNTDVIHFAKVKGKKRK